LVKNFDKLAAKSQRTELDEKVAKHWHSPMNYKHANNKTNNDA